MKRIAIVDDDEGILDALQLLLEELGYAVTTVSNGRAIAKLTVPYPDVILLDLWMSGIDGRDICRKLKAKERTRHIPIIIISANKDTAQIAREAGADDYILKPFDAADLQRKIEKYT